MAQSRRGGVKVRAARDRDDVDETVAESAPHARDEGRLGQLEAENWDALRKVRAAARSSSSAASGANPVAADDPSAGEAAADDERLASEDPDNLGDDGAPAPGPASEASGVVDERPRARRRADVKDAAIGTDDPNRVLPAAARRSRNAGTEHTGVQAGEGAD